MDVACDSCQQFFFLRSEDRLLCPRCGNDVKEVIE